MQTLEEILRAAQHLSDDDRRKLVEKLHVDKRQEPVDQQRRDTMSSWLGLAGTFHSDFIDASTDKYKHLADVYSDGR